MNIRCERCSTVYELEDGLLPPEGSDVQCTRCQHVFRAHPPQAPGRTLRGTPAATPSQPRATPSPSRAVAAPHGAQPAQGAHATPAHGGAPAAAAGRRPAVYRSQVSQPSVARAPVLRRDTVGAFESRLRWSHRWRWLAPSLVAGAAVAVVLVYLARGITLDHGAVQSRSRALTLALADDEESLEKAADALRSVIETSPRSHAARADRALVELLLAGALSEPEPRGAERERALALAASAASTLDELARADLAPAEVARARAVAASLSGGRVELRRLATAARAALPEDVFVTLAEHSADVRSTDRSVREQTVRDLQYLLARRPELSRARYLLAKGLALAGRRNEALAAVEDLLRRNPRHGGALRLRDAITLPPPTAPIAPPGASSAAPLPEPEPPPPRPVPPVKQASVPRNADSTAGESGSVVPPEQPSAAGATPEAGTGAPPPAETEPAPPPRLRPAAVPEPEVVEGGG